jgi:hypothetical protein
LCEEPNICPVFGDTLKIDAFISSLREKMSIHSERMNKYLLSPHLNFLIGTGCSLDAGAELINEGDSKYDDVLEDLKSGLGKDMEQSIEALKSPDIRIEQKLDKLSKIECFYTDVCNDPLKLDLVKKCILKIKEKFLKTCVLN